jgi:ABC-type multidrug transport system fused ATPase/permease subunit
VAAQRAIADMRMSMQRHITRLPTSYFDSTQTGVLISRVMNDADGIRNLVGSGLVQMIGGMLTAVFALGILFYLNWRLTLFSIVVLAIFAGGMILAFRNYARCSARAARSPLNRQARRIVRRHPDRQAHTQKARRPRVCDRRPRPVRQRGGR